jgi:hypothetical protein
MTYDVIYPEARVTWQLYKDVPVLVGNELV